MPRKHLVASQTNKKQQMQAKLWQKLAREIKAAVKTGGTNIEANPRLKAAVDKALQHNLSRESIERNIHGQVKDTNELTTLEFECYGPNGLQIIVSAVTDNINRTTSNLRGYLSKLHAEITKPNSVKIFFEKYGLIDLLKTSTSSLDQIMDLTLNYQVVDIVELNDGYEVLTIPTDFYNVKKILIDHQYQIYEAEIKLISKNKIANLSSEIESKLERFIESCNLDDDIQSVVTNYDF